MAKNIKGPAIFLAQFAGDHRSPSTRWTQICRLGRRAWATRACRSRAGTARLIDLKKAAESQDLLRGDPGHAGQAPRPRDHRALDSSAGPARRGAPGLRRGLRRLRGGGRARQAGGAAAMGGASRCTGRGEGLGATWGSRRFGDLLGRAGLAFRVLPGRRARRALIEDRLRLSSRRRWLPDPRCLSTSGGRGRGLRAPSGRGPARRRQLRDVPRAARRTIRAPATCNLRSRATSCCSSSTTWPSSTIYPRAHQGLPREGRRVQSRPASQGVYSAASSPGSKRAGRFRSLGDGQVDFKRRLLEAGGSTTMTGWAVLEWECCLKDSRGGRAPRERLSSPSHIIKRGRPKAFDDFAAGGAVDKKQIQRMLGI
jgi:hypothetical protein